MVSQVNVLMMNLFASLHYTQCDYILMFLMWYVLNLTNSCIRLKYILNVNLYLLSLVSTKLYSLHGEIHHASYSWWLR